MVMRIELKSFLTYALTGFCNPSTVPSNIAEALGGKCQIELYFFHFEKEK